jgi:hypothetical protein
MHIEYIEIVPQEFDARTAPKTLDLLRGDLGHELWDSDVKGYLFANMRYGDLKRDRFFEGRQTAQKFFEMGYLRFEILPFAPVFFVRQASGNPYEKKGHLQRVGKSFHIEPTNQEKCAETRDNAEKKG